MWRVAILAAACAAGCFRPAPPDGQPCAPASAEARCPDGQGCVVEGGVEVCRAGGLPLAADAAAPDAAAGPDAAARPDAPLPDRDLDGVADPLDNCPDRANPDQENEDGDARGDLCDPCPPFPDVTPPADGDGDGVGDACDPHPSTPGDAIVLFEGFHGPLSPGWSSASGATWTVFDDDVLVDSTSASSPGVLTIPTPQTMTPPYTVLAGVTPLSPHGATLGLGIAADYVAPSTGMMCGLIRDLASPPSESIGLYALGAGVYKARDPLPFAVTHAYALILSRTPASYLCAGRDLVTDATAGVSGADTLNNRRPVLRIVNAWARYHWVMVVDSP